MLKTTLTLLAFFLHSATAHALDAASAEALRKTQAMMNDPAAVQKFAGTNAQAQSALDKAKAATGNDPKKLQELNSISSEIFGTIVRRNQDASGNVDNQKLEQQLNAAMRDPAKFMQSLPPEQRARIQQLAAEVEKSKAASK